MTSRPLPLEFVTSAPGVSELPDAAAEVALVGRSNVGKSTLLNALAGRKQLARTSKTPGRTQLLNVFVAPNGAQLVDAPGYGYAKAPADVRARWQRRLRQYLVEREPLTAVLVLLDAEVGPTRQDLELLELLDEHDRPYALVATKHDKVRSSRRARRRRELADACGVEESQVLWVSAHRDVNLDRLRELVAELLGLDEGQREAQG